MKVKEENEKAVLKLNIQKTKIMASGPIITWQIGGGNNGNSDRLNFPRLQNHWGWWLQPLNWQTLAPWKKSYDKTTQHIKKQRHHFADKGLCSQNYGFSSSHACMWELDHKEGWRIDASNYGARESKGLLSIFFSTTIWKHQFFGAQTSLWDPILTSIHDYWKSNSFDYMDLCQQRDVSAF